MGPLAPSGAAFAALRVGHGLSVSELSRVAAVNRRTILRAQRGEPVRAEARDRLALVLGPELYETVPLLTAEEERVARVRAADNVIGNARAERGLSLAQAARAIGIAKGTLANAEHGEHIYPATAKKIAVAYGLSVLDVAAVSDPSILQTEGAR